MLAHLILTPLLILSQPPWSEMSLLLVRGTLGCLYLLALRTLLRVWWVRRDRAGERLLGDGVIPLILAGVGLVLLCSAHRSSVDQLFTRVDRVLMDRGTTDERAAVNADASWYEVLSVPDARDTRDAYGLAAPVGTAGNASAENTNIKSMNTENTHVQRPVNPENAATPGGKP